MLTKKQIENRCKKIESLKAEKKELEKLISELENEIKDTMQESELMEVGTYKIYWSWYESQRLDTKRLKEDNERIYNKYSSVVRTRRFTIK